MRWKLAVYILFVLGYCLVGGKAVAMWFGPFHLNWVAASFWCLALLFMVWAWKLYNEASLSYFDGRSGRHKPRFSKLVLARFAARTMAISALIFFVGVLVQVYF